VTTFHSDIGNDPGLNFVQEYDRDRRLLLDHENNGILMFYKG
jgi:hypothetical protein